MNAKPAIDKQQLADNFATAMKGTLEQDKIDAAVNTMLTDDTESFSANGSVVSAVFYQRFTLQFEFNGTNYQYVGNAGGIGSPGGGVLIGELWTGDAQTLINNTVSFQYQTTMVASNINFFDGNSNILGYFIGGAVSTVNAIGGGKGTWHTMNDS